MSQNISYYVLNEIIRKWRKKGQYQKNTINITKCQGYFKSFVRHLYYNYATIKLTYYVIRIWFL